LQHAAGNNSEQDANDGDGVGGNGGKERRGVKPGGRKKGREKRGRVVLAHACYLCYPTPVQTPMTARRAT